VPVDQSCPFERIEQLINELQQLIKALSEVSDREMNPDTTP